jgi:hypothetical protein
MNVIQWAQSLTMFSFFVFGFYVALKRKGAPLSDTADMANDQSRDTAAEMTDAYLLVPCMSGFLGDTMGMQHLSSAYLSGKTTALRGPEAGTGEPAKNGRLHPNSRGER